MHNISSICQNFSGVHDHRDGKDGFIRRLFYYLAVRVTSHIKLSELNRFEILLIVVKIVL